MNQTIFYSWQADTNPKENRSLIQDALDQAIKHLQRIDCEIAPNRDQDTMGVPGSPQISDSILAKIATSRIYIADITPINFRKKTGPLGFLNAFCGFFASKTKLTPNPNVLIEVGYAAALLGWENIILVQNSKYGSPKDLPFDISSRRILTYKYDSSMGVKPGESRQTLSKSISDAINSVLNENETSIITGTAATMWLGTWNYSGNSKSYSGVLDIVDICSNSFRFILNVGNGGNLGNIDGIAIITAPNHAIAIIENGNNNSLGELQFIRAKSGGGVRKIRVIETKSCRNFCGNGVHFEGEYRPESDLLIDNSIASELEIHKLQMLFGERYKTFSQNFQELSFEYTDILATNIVRGGIKGLYTYMESILMRDGNGGIWAALLDSESVVYVTNTSEWKKKLPDSFADWRSRFQHAQVIFLD